MPKSTRITHWRQRRQKHSGRGWRLVLKGGGLILLLLILAGGLLSAASVSAATAVYAYFTQDLPDFAEIERSYNDPDALYEGAKIYAWADSGDGRREPVLIYDVTDPLAGERRWLTLDEIPLSLIEATVALEDSAFWASPGFDGWGVGRAFYEYAVWGRDSQAGSAIIQRLITNNLLTTERQTTGLDGYRRKLEELLLAQEIARTYTKEQIIEWYLNAGYYGNLAYGLEAAARVYFDKPAAELTLAEAAMLAAIPQAPALNPIDNPEQAKIRQALVLEAMQREGYISRDAMVAAQFAPLVVSSSIEERFDIIAPHFALYARRELERRFGPQQLLRGGLRVYTSLDLTMQRQAECLSRAHIGRLQGALTIDLAGDELAGCPALDFLPPLRTADLGIDHNVSNAALVAIDPRTGEIKAIMGSLDYWDGAIDGAFNMAVDGRRQPGPAMKPFVYLTALSQGYTAATMVFDVATEFDSPADGGVYAPRNANGEFRGPMRLRTALGNGYNVPAVQVTSWVGVDNVIRTARSMGAVGLEQGRNQFGLSLPLGGGEARLLDLVYAYSVMNNMGVMIGQQAPLDETKHTLNPVAILRVEDQQGRVLYEYTQPERREILTPQLAFVMNDMLADRNARCAGLGCPNTLELPGNRLAAAMTGVTHDFRDGWAIGYTPQLVTGVWVGNSDNAPMRDLPAWKGAAPVWQAFMFWALQNEPAQGWTRPSGLLEMTVCDISGLLPTPHCPRVTDYFIMGTQPTVYDNIFQEFRLNRETGRLATIYTPPELVETRIFPIFPEQAADWARENGIERPPTEYDTINAPITAGNAIISSPRPFAFVNGQVAITGSALSDDFAYYRVAYFAGLTPRNMMTIADKVTEPQENGVLAVWDASNLNGLFTLLLTVVRNDGTFDEISLPLTVDNMPPAVQIIAPTPDDTIFTDAGLVVVVAEANDDIGVERVAFYVDNAGAPFALATTAPFSANWPIRGTGCHTFRVTAVDLAGNKGESAPVRVCLTSRE